MTWKHELQPWCTCWPMQELHRSAIILQLCVIIAELDLRWWSSWPISSSSPSLTRTSWKSKPWKHYQQWDFIQNSCLIFAFPFFHWQLPTPSLWSCCVGNRTLFGGCADSADSSVTADSGEEVFISAFRGNTQSSSISCSWIRTTQTKTTSALGMASISSFIVYNYHSSREFVGICMLGLNSEKKE